MANLIDIIPVVEAQSADAVAQPTFGPIQGAGGGTATASVLIKSDKTAINVGDTFKVTVTINTQNLTVSEYRVVVNYDPSALSVVDQDPSTPGTQVNILDNVFQVTNPQTNNVASNGSVVVDAKVNGSNEVPINNRDVIQITFQAQTAGTTTISVAQGTNGTQLIKLQGTSVAFTQNEISTVISSQSGSSSSSFSSSSSSISSSSSNSSGSSSSVPHVIPNTAITDNPELLGSLLIGVVLIITGASLTRGRKNEKN